MRQSEFLDARTEPKCLMCQTDNSTGDNIENSIVEIISVAERNSFIKFLVITIYTLYIYGFVPKLSQMIDFET